MLSASVNEADKTFNALSTVRDVRFAPAGNVMASLSAEGLTTLWNVKDWSRRRSHRQWIHRASDSSLFR